MVFMLLMDILHQVFSYFYNFHFKEDILNLKDDKETLEDKKDEKIENTTDELTKNLLNTAITKVLEVRKERNRKWSNQAEQDKETVDQDRELANILEIKPDQDSQNFTRSEDSKVTRPVSPVFGGNQEETNEDWFYDFEDFSTPQNFNQENNQDIQERKSVEILKSRLEPPATVVPHKNEQIMKICELGVDYFYDNFTLDDNLTDDIVMSLEIPDDLIDSCDVINDGENCKNIDVESEKTFKISILHLTRDLTWEIIKSYKIENKNENFTSVKRRPSYCRSKPKNKQDVCKAVQDEIWRNFKFDTQKKINKKINIKKRDRVDHILTEELLHEERDWTNYSNDEYDVKMQLCDVIMDNLIDDVIMAFDEVKNKKKRRNEAETEATEV